MEPIEAWLGGPEYVAKRGSTPADKPPPGYHYDPYKRAWRRNLTEAQVQNLWPYKKETPVQDPVVSTKKDWRKQDAALVNGTRFDNPETGEMHDAPAIRKLGPMDTSKPPAVDAETLEAMQAVMAQANEFVAEGKLKPVDNVVLPKHYARFKIEPIRFICENGLNFFQGNVIKYVLRFDAKNGLEDLRKARRYLNMFILYVEGNPDWWKAA